MMHSVKYTINTNCSRLHIFLHATTKTTDRLAVVGGRELKCQEGCVAYVGMNFVQVIESF